ncbi:type II toxin-antitoxin system RelE/ParE family toxin [Sphingomonas yantingensis]|uniref:Toxin ParE1/3/4 n=1 Tax=Sphingomonas yantingensis TaxID=1241761 RepID=A0A7W9ATN0_9SPHN|nr:toxin ParE1/3/4 [Sphingomonas yantingensis]
MIRYRVDVTGAAEADLEQVRRWLVLNAGVDAADRFLGEVATRIDTLEAFPARGSVPAPLADLDETIRQMPVGAWRLLYDVDERSVGEGVVTIFAIVHERRSLVDALAERQRR